MSDATIQQLVNETVAIIRLNMDNKATGEKIVKIEAIDEEAADQLFFGLADLRIKGIQVTGQTLNAKTRTHLDMNDPLDVLLAKIMEKDDPCIINIGFAPNSTGDAKYLLDLITMWDQAQRSADHL